MIHHKVEENICMVGRVTLHAPNVYFLIPRTYEYIILHGKGTLQI